MPTFTFFIKLFIKNFDAKSLSLLKFCITLFIRLRDEISNSSLLSRTAVAYSVFHQGSALRFLSCAELRNMFLPKRGLYQLQVWIVQKYHNIYVYYVCVLHEVLQPKIAGCDKIHKVFTKENFITEFGFQTNLSTN